MQPSTVDIQINISIRGLRMILLKTWRSAAFGVYGYLNFTKAAYLEHSKRYNPEDMQTKIEGKNCVVTGANSGIGYATAEGLASRGANVYMVCRSKERGEAARSKIQSMTGNENVYLELVIFLKRLIKFSSQVCDLSSVNEIKSFTSRFTSKDVPIHVLVNNAGLLEHNRITTSEGTRHELNFAVNVLGTYTMTELMLPLLEKAAPDSRVITVSSGGMYTTPLTEDLQVHGLVYFSSAACLLQFSSTLWNFSLFVLLQFSHGNFDGVEQYARNKRIQIALTEKWAETYKDKGIGFYSMHPGWAETPGVANSLPGFSKSLSGKLRTSEQGADTVIWLALMRKEKLLSGAFYFDRVEAPKHLKFAATGGSHAAAMDSIINNLRSLSSLSSYNETQQ
ncbi:hypothetical protein RHGRI_017249 [Rhododendron griersonianum]|uniref:Dehydrogenase/reductase SDR family member 12 n=1 Tax=Rhododendron griersonianum TaxID=479676 RepID=A0AAV6JX37_9ERIC|nr:hypothetical protein RHGRI_017249 [Rhododendron griersonianum]